MRAPLPALTADRRRELAAASVAGHNVTMTAGEVVELLTATTARDAAPPTPGDPTAAMLHAASRIAAFAEAVRGHHRAPMLAESLLVTLGEWTKLLMAAVGRDGR